MLYFNLWNPGIAGGDIINANKGDYYPFRVDINGKLYAKDADIEGHINATSGSFTGTIEAKSVLSAGIVIGAWTITDYGIHGIDGSGNNVNLTPKFLEAGDGPSGGSVSWYSVYTVAKSLPAIRNEIEDLKNRVYILEN